MNFKQSLEKLLTPFKTFKGKMVFVVLVCLFVLYLSNFFFFRKEGFGKCEPKNVTSCKSSCGDNYQIQYGPLGPNWPRCCKIGKPPDCGGECGGTNWGCCPQSNRALCGGCEGGTWKVIPGDRSGQGQCVPDGSTLGCDGKINSGATMQFLLGNES
jgi:hypothetical protein